MATTKKNTRPRGKGPAIKPTRADGRPKSKLTLAAETAARDAKRELLLKTLRAEGWNLAATARSLELAGASDVIRAIRDTGLDAEYEAAKQRGDVRSGPRAD